MNQVFFAIIALAFIFSVINGTPAEVGSAALESATTAVELAIGLVGLIALFLGLLKIVEEAGGLRFMARMIRPIMIRLFPEIPPDHPAMGAMIMNVSANALGLGNAATPFGIKAMEELNTLNKEEGTATNAMVLFLAINTSGLALLPTGIIGLRQIYGSVDPAVIFPTTLIATACSTVIGILVAKTLSGLGIFKAPQAQLDADRALAERPSASTQLVDWLLLLCFICGMVGLVLLVYIYKEQASVWIMPTLIIGMLTLGVVRKVPVYEVFVKGAKDGFSIALLIIPYMVAILAAVGMLRKSGGLEVLVTWLGQATQLVGMPAEVLPLALLRPLSGSGSFAITADLLETHGPDSFIGQLASTMNGSTETTFYVLAVYFGAVGVSKTRHAVPAGVAADITGVLASVFAVRTLLSPVAGEPMALAAQGDDVVEAVAEVALPTLCEQTLEPEGWTNLLKEPERPLIESGQNHRISVSAKAGQPLRIQACKAVEGGRLRIILLDNDFREITRSRGQGPDGSAVLEPVLVFTPVEDIELFLILAAPEMPPGAWAVQTELIVQQQAPSAAP
jgi:spore maturation protein SpmA/spore maturation protein SpmB